MSDPTNEAELNAYFRDWIDTAFQSGLISPDAKDEIERLFTKYLPELVLQINRSRQARLRLPRKTLRIILRAGRDPDPKIGGFNMFEMQWSPRAHPLRLSCFVGHRFDKRIESALRNNLAYIFHPANIRLIWSGQDMRATGFFDAIVKEIQQCGFCFFDNRETSGRPNVYIEAGIAYALKRPFIFANHQDSRIEIPTDLSHILNVPYVDYRDLMRGVYFRLPLFLKGSGLQRRRG